MKKMKMKTIVKNENYLFQVLLEINNFFLIITKKLLSFFISIETYLKLRTIENELEQLNDKN